MNSAAPTPANAGPNRAIVQNITPQQYQADFTSREHLLIDVRTREEFASGHIAGAVNIPVEEIGSRLSEIPADETVVLYCRSGNRSAQASQILNQNGYSTVYDLGGVIAWTAAGLPLE
ncbi:MAG: rhodanese-like domain-containing protein [Anaerolinea sp.]|nr:rhodanese-like domain-containing protein [Anaerolinea sp.]